MQLNGFFSVSGKRCKVNLADNGINWEEETNLNCSNTRHVASHEIVSCWLCPKGSIRCCSQRLRATDSKHTTGACKHWGHGFQGIGFSLEVCERTGSGYKWNTRVITFHHPASDVVFTWHTAIWSHISDIKQRPAHLLVVVNPYGGRKVALQKYRRKVAPYFQRAGIHTTVVQTCYPEHATLLMQDLDDGKGDMNGDLKSMRAKYMGNGDSQSILKQVDGVVAVGGDGLVSELARGMLLSASQRDHIDPDDPDSILPSTPVRLGIIPGGSTDATCHATHGTSDLITAALHIIMGDHKPIDIAAVYSDGKLQGVATSLASWGYFGDLMSTSEKWRCLGPSRYILSGMWKILCNKSYDISLKIRRPTGSNSVPVTNYPVCNDQCITCSKASLHRYSLFSDGVQDDWIEKRGRFQVVSATVTNCTSRLNKRGLSPSAHLGDGCTDIILVEGTSRFKLLSYLMKTCRGTAMNLNYVNIMRGKELHFTAKQCPEVINSFWSCDGELIQAPSAIIKVHCQKLNLFCRGVELQDGN